MGTLAEKKLFLLDMDGTIYLGDRLFDGAAEFLRRVRARGGRYVFLTNNSSRGTDAYIEKLGRMGVPAQPEDFLTSADAAIAYLQKTAPDALYYVCGTRSLIAQLRAAGLRVTDTLADDVDALLLGYDTELTYRKLEDCCILLNRGVRYIATHPDLVCPTSYGFAPDCGSVIEMLDTACHRRPKILGKPQPEMVWLALERFSCAPQDACLIGDRVYTDIACGQNAGIDTVFVLSGEGVITDCENQNIHPTWTLPNIQAVLEAL